MERRYEIRQFGAVGDGRTLDSVAIQRAFDTVSEKGGGTVVVPSGTFLCGSLFLREHVALELQKGGRLLGSRNIDDYRFGETRFEGRMCPWPSALLNGENLTDVEIRGEGTIDGNGMPFWKEFWDRRQEAIAFDLPFSNRDVPRPRLLYLSHCNRISLAGLSLCNAGFWHIHLYDCHHVLCEGVSVRTPEAGYGERAPSTDGIDIDSCSDVVVRNASFQTDDDCICLKSGKGVDAHEVNGPTENIVIDSCRFGFGHGAVTFGSEAATIRNVVVRNCTVTGENTMIRMKFRNDTLQHFENILFEDLKLFDSGWLFSLQPWVSRQDEILTENILPSFVDNLIVRRVAATALKSPGIIMGDGSSVHIDNVTLEDIAMTSSATGAGLSRFDTVEAKGEQTARSDGLRVEHVEHLSMQSVTLDGNPLSV